MKCLTAKLVTNILSYSSRLTNFVYYEKIFFSCISSRGINRNCNT
jgi:hypothetical protein